MLILGLNQACFLNRKVGDSLCVYFIFNQKKCVMLKNEKKSSIDKSFGLMFQLKGFVLSKLEPDPDDPDDPDEGTEDPPVLPPTGNN